MNFEGINEFAKILDQIDRDIVAKGNVSALRQAAKPIQEGAKTIIKNARTTRKGTDSDGFSKLFYLSTLVRIRTKKSTVNVQFVRRDEVPIQGLKNRSGFDAFGYAKLLAQGRKWTSKGSASRSGNFTGYTKGLGDFIDESFNRNGATAAKIFKRVRVPQIQKTFNRAVKRHGIRG